MFYYFDDTDTMSFDLKKKLNQIDQNRAV